MHLITFLGEHPHAYFTAAELHRILAMSSAQYLRQRLSDLVAEGRVERCEGVIYRTNAPAERIELYHYRH